MREGELIMTLIMSGMLWKSTSSNVWKDLGSSPMYAILYSYSLLF